MRRRTVLRIGAGVLAGLAARSASADTPTPGDLADDIAIMRDALALHPGLHRYADPAQVEARLARLKAAFAASRSLEERYLLLSRFLATIRCGHSYCNFFNQRRAVAADLFDRPTRLPFRFAWVGGAMVVTRDPARLLPPGTRVLAVNGRSASALLAMLMPYARADGGNDAKRVSLLEVRGGRIETFDVFQGLIAPPTGAAHRLLVVPPYGAPRTLDMPAIGLAARRAQATAEERAPDAPLWTWEMRPDGVALLTMPDWAVWNSKWDWKTWLESRLDSLGRAKGLLIDLRANEGGADCGDTILARMIDRPFTPPRLEQRLRFRRTPAALDPFLDTWDQSFRTLGEGAAPLPGGFFRRPGGEEAVAVAPAGRRLATPVAVLTSPVNSSATHQFASNLRALGGGRLVGEATGGNRRGINGGCFFFVRLPASGIEFDLPLVGYFPTAPEPDAGIAPDVPVPRTVRAIAAGRDAALERAAALFA